MRLWNGSNKRVLLAVDIVLHLFDVMPAFVFKSRSVQDNGDKRRASKETRLQKFENLDQAKANDYKLALLASQDIERSDVQFIVDSQMDEVSFTTSQVADDRHFERFEILINIPIYRHLNKFVAPKHFCRFCADLTVDGENAGEEPVGRREPGILCTALRILAVLCVLVMKKVPVDFIAKLAR
ncbi:hypothetical protein KC360_g151 [Hortaea werneckii]|nr:hypothetical protein KC360_g151 [Hortaea werneckii]